MGKTYSRRGASAAPDAEPSRKRRRGRNVRAAHAKPPRTQHIAPVAPSSSAPLSRHAPVSFAPGPSLRQDTPRPPLRTLLLRARRHGRLAWRHGLDRWHAAQRELHRRWRALVSRARASAARIAAHTIAHLDARVWQPATWPFRPAQREMLARAVAALSVAFVALGWIAAYSTLAPTQDARPAAPPAAPPKPFTERLVSRALPLAQVPVQVPAQVPVDVPKAEARLDMAHDVTGDLAHDLAPAAGPQQAALPLPVPAKHKAGRASVKKKTASKRHRRRRHRQ